MFQKVAQRQRQGPNCYIQCKFSPWHKRADAEKAKAIGTLVHYN